MNAEDVDMVNHPPHYTSKQYEVIDILEEFFKDDPLLWQCGKYLLRCKEKGNTVSFKLSYSTPQNHMLL